MPYFSSLDTYSSADEEKNMKVQGGEPERGIFHVRGWIDSVQNHGKMKSHSRNKKLCAIKVAFDALASRRQFRRQNIKYYTVENNRNSFSGETWQIFSLINNNSPYNISTNVGCTYVCMRACTCTQYSTFFNEMNSMNSVDQKMGTLWKGWWVRRQSLVGHIV